MITLNYKFFDIFFINITSHKICINKFYNGYEHTEQQQQQKVSN